MTKPIDDLEAVRLITEALQGFDPNEQERIIRWAQEKLGRVAPVPPPARASARAPVPSVFDLSAPPIAPPVSKSPSIGERFAREVPEAVQREAEPPAWQPEVKPHYIEVSELEQPAAERPEPEPPTERRPEIAGVAVPEPEHKSRLFLIIGIVALTLAVAFLIFMITSSHT